MRRAARAAAAAHVDSPSEAAMCDSWHSTLIGQRMQIGPAPMSPSSARGRTTGPLAAPPEKYFDPHDARAVAWQVAADKAAANEPSDSDVVSSAPAGNESSTATTSLSASLLSVPRFAPSLGLEPADLSTPVIHEEKINEEENEAEEEATQEAHTQQAEQEESSAVAAENNQAQQPAEEQSVAQPPLSLLFTAFSPRSTHASRLRALASPRCAATLNVAHGTRRARSFSSSANPARLANSPGAHTGFGSNSAAAAAAAVAAAAGVHFDPVAWSAAMMQQSENDESEQLVSDLQQDADSEAAAAAGPRVHHTAFPARRAPLQLGQFAVAAREGISPGSLSARNHKARPASAGGSGSAHVAKASPAAGRAGMVRAAMVSARLRPASARASALSHHDAEAAVEMQSPEPAYEAFQTQGALAKATAGAVRPLKVVTFNSLESTQKGVYSALHYHPDEARLFKHMWTPNSLITSSGTY